MKMNINRTIVLISTFVLAPIIFIVGLVSPLTPSEGLPSVIDLFIFWIIPLLIIAYAISFFNNRWIITTLWFEFLIVFGFELFLFSIQL